MKAGVIQCNSIVVDTVAVELLGSSLSHSAQSPPGTVCIRTICASSLPPTALPASAPQQHDDHAAVLRLTDFNWGLNLPNLIRKEVDKVSIRDFYVCIGDFIVVKQVIVLIQADLIHRDKICDLGRVMCLSSKVFAL